MYLTYFLQAQIEESETQKNIVQSQLSSLSLIVQTKKSKFAAPPTQSKKLEIRQSHKKMANLVSTQNLQIRLLKLLFPKVSMTSFRFSNTVSDQSTTERTL